MKDHSFMESDVIVIGGGNIIGPGFWLFKDSNIDLLETHKNIVFLNVGVTKDSFHDHVFRDKIINLKAKWWVRDIESQDILSTFNVQSTFLPDISLTLSDRINVVKKTKTIGVLLNAYPLNDLFNNNDVYLNQRAHQFARVLAHHLDWMASFGWKIEFIPCHISTLIDDRIIAAVVMGYMKRKECATWHVEKHNWMSIAGLIAQCELVFSMRYHASTTAVATHTPFVDLVHHDKNKQFVKYMDMESCAVNIWSASHQDMIQATTRSEASSTKHWIQPGIAVNLWKDFDKQWIDILG